MKSFLPLEVKQEDTCESRHYSELYLLPFLPELKNFVFLKLFACKKQARNISFFFLSGDEVTCGKFYASFLIQDYFKKFRKRKERERKSKKKDKAASLQVTHHTVSLLNFPPDVFYDRKLICRQKVYLEYLVSESCLIVLLNLHVKPPLLKTTETRDMSISF